MNKGLISIYGFILMVSLIASCNDENRANTQSNCGPTQKLQGERKNLNVSIFLDLSNRISPTFNPNPAMEYWKRDLGYVNAIAKAFETHLRNKRSVLINDNIKMFLHPLPETIKDINQTMDELNKSFTRENATLNRICSISDDYKKLTTNIYSSTLESKETSAKKGEDNYPGSDIFDFFKSKVKDYCIKSDHRNILFILTDGYMYMSKTNNINKSNKSNYLLSKQLTQWGFNSNNYKDKIKNKGFGFQVPSNELDGLEVFVVGLSPKRSWELDVLKAYWGQWLRDMGVKNFQSQNSNKYLKQADLPSQVDELIQEFIYK